MLWEKIFQNIKLPRSVRGGGGAKPGYPCVGRPAYSHTYTHLDTVRRAHAPTHNSHSAEHLGLTEERSPAAEHQRAHSPSPSPYAPPPPPHPLPLLNSYSYYTALYSQSYQLFNFYSCSDHNFKSYRSFLQV